jgi:hypothetical protein
MKFVAVTLLAFVAAAIAGPISVSDNNVGDIVTVGINANAVLSSQIDQNIFSVIAALLNQQAIVATDGQAPAETPAESSQNFQNSISHQK